MLEAVIKTEKRFNFINQGPFYEPITPNGLSRPLSLNGVGESSIVVENTPYGNDNVLRIARVDGTTGVQGGFSLEPGLRLEPDKAYRCSVWVRVEASALETNARLVFGLNRINSEEHAQYKDTSSILNNAIEDPQFVNVRLSSVPKDRWLLFVGLLNQTGERHLSVESGFYTTGGTKYVVGTRYELTFLTEQILLSGLKMYLIDGVRSDTVVKLYHPRMEFVSSKNPTIDDLLGVKFP